jgi:AraC-like DNA-binding protein
MAVAASGWPAPIGTDGKDGLAAAARAVIDGELGSTGLNATRLCQLLGVSRSTLHRLFEVDGGVQAYVRSRRLEAVRSVLADGGANEPLHLLAERFGFSDSAHLSRLFRSRFEMTPTEFRGRIRNEQPHKRP